MIDPSKLTEADKGRRVNYRQRTQAIAQGLEPETGILTSWNSRFVFVKFKGPTGEACEPQDVTFETSSETDNEMPRT